jgi:Ca2+-binding RTX toxin-like protein
VVGIALAPRDATNPVGTTHTVTATRTDTSGNPVAGSVVTFSVTGAIAGANGTCNPVGCETDAQGKVTFTYTGNSAGSDEIGACFTPSGGNNPPPVCAATAKKTWTQTAQAPGPRPEGCGLSIDGVDLLGDDAKNNLNGTPATDRLRGGGGNDRLVGAATADCLRGDAGNDKITGDAGNDIIRGGADKDNISGGEGDDNVRAQNGDDVVNGGPGNDTLKAQARGADKVKCGTGTDSVVGDVKDTIADDCEKVRIVDPR